MQASDVEHEAAGFAASVHPSRAHPESIDEHVDGTAVFPTQRDLKVPNMPILFQGITLALAIFGRKINLSRNIYLQKFFAAGVAEHRHQGVIHFNKSTLGRAEEQAFLDMIE